MNERIRELHNQACRIDMEHYPNAIPDGERIQQKFAELIVRECIEIIDYNDLVGSSTEYYGKKFKQHFGVES